MRKRTERMSRSAAERKSGRAAENVPGWSVRRGFITDINNADKNVLSESFCKSKYKEDFESA